MAARASLGRGGKSPTAPARAPATVAAPAAKQAPAAAPPLADSMPDMPPEPPPFDDIPPPWEQGAMPAGLDTQKKTEVPAVVTAASPPAPAAPQRPAATPAQQQETARVATDIGWDGHWPSLAAKLPLRGVVHQMAFQSELVRLEALAGGNVCFHLRIPLETLRSSGSAEKLMTALSEHFAREVRVETEIGAVTDTASAAAQADRAERQREAERKMRNDPFVLTMMREFDASIVPGSINPL